jgi:hypothetical protein
MQPKQEKKSKQTNPHKWIYNQVDIIGLIAELELMASDLECNLKHVEGRKNKIRVEYRIGVVRAAAASVRAMSDQQIHLARGIEKLKAEVKKLKNSG